MMAASREGATRRRKKNRTGSYHLATMRNDDALLSFCTVIPPCSAERLRSQNSYQKFFMFPVGDVRCLQDWI